MPPFRSLLAPVVVAAILTGSLVTEAAEHRSGATAAGPAAGGYWMVASDGGIFSFGDAPFHGSTGGIRLNQPIVGMAPTSSGGAGGYWTVASDGGIFAFGDAGFYGSTGSITLNKPIVGMAPTPTGNGYWMVASDGGIFAFGDAGFYGSTGSITLNKPIVGMAPTPTGNGYWMVASDGGMFAFGDAGFYGSGQPSGRAFAGMASSPTGRGYWLATTAGEVLNFGDATPLGGTSTAAPVVGVEATSTGRGYWLVTATGAVFNFGDAPAFGSAAGIALNQPMVGFAPAPARPPSGAPSSPTSTTTTTRPRPDTPAEPEVFAPIEATGGSGNTPTEQLSTTGNNCGFPSAPRTTPNPEQDNLGEASGMAASTRHPGVFWMIRDGANPPRNAIYRVRIGSDGAARSKAIPVPGTHNGDWEEVTYSIGPDGKGRLWAVESGQQTPTGQYRDIYEILEPDPDADSAKLLNKYTYALPQGRDHNIEAAMTHRGFLVLVGKKNPHAPVFIFDTLEAGVTNIPTYLGTLGFSEDISVIRKSPDGTMLVTASHTVTHMYRSTDGSGTLRSFMGNSPDCELHAFPEGSVEAGEWRGNDEMVFLSEGPQKESHRLAIEP